MIENMIIINMYIYVYVMVLYEGSGIFYNWINLKVFF